jgi:hypothetical protein
VSCTSSYMYIACTHSQGGPILNTQGLSVVTSHFGLRTKSRMAVNVIPWWIKMRLRLRAIKT